MIADSNDRWANQTFSVSGVSKPVPYLPEGRCIQNAQLLEHLFPELAQVTGTLVEMESGTPSQWLRHAWNVTPAGDVVDSSIRPEQPGLSYEHIPDGVQHDARRDYYRTVFGQDPEPFDDDHAAIQLADAGMLKDLAVMEGQQHQDQARG